MCGDERTLDPTIHEDNINHHSSLWDKQLLHGGNARPSVLEQRLLQVYVMVIGFAARSAKAVHSWGRDQIGTFSLSLTHGWLQPMV